MTNPSPMARHSDFRLPVRGWPKARFESDYGFSQGALKVDGEPVLTIDAQSALASGARGTWREHTLELRLVVSEDNVKSVELQIDGKPAIREEDLSMRPSRSAWVHAWISLAASAFGFIAGYIYLVKAEGSGELWPRKMATHMAGWHLLLTFTLFPASVWGQRVGIRSVQAASTLFFLIHVGISLANIGSGDGHPLDGWIAGFNAASGVCFLASIVYGQIAYRDMDPIRALAGLDDTPDVALDLT